MGGKVSSEQTACCINSSCFVFSTFDSSLMYSLLSKQSWVMLEYPILAAISVCSFSFSLLGMWYLANQIINSKEI